MIRKKKHRQQIKKKINNDLMRKKKIVNTMEIYLFNNLKRSLWFYLLT
jgi:hypothetical protein